MAYAHQYVEGRGAVAGGLTSFEPPSDDYFYLDHDQRHTLTGGVEYAIDASTSVSGSMNFGSGFLEGDGPDHLPPHATFDVQASHVFGRQWTAFVTALNVANTHYLVDESNTFGGTHYNSPRQVFAGVRFRFRY